MKERYRTHLLLRQTSHFVMLLILISFLSGCTAGRFTRIVVEHDTVKSSQRIKKGIYYRKAQEKDTPLYSARQTFVMEVNASSGVACTVFDVLDMSTNAYALENKVYLMADGEILPVHIDRHEKQDYSFVSEDKGSILAADSTAVSVVTGYTQHNGTKFRISYRLTPEMIDQIRTSEELKFRYYSGPNMITLRMRRGDLRKLKKMIEMI